MPSLCERRKRIKDEYFTQLHTEILRAENSRWLISQMRLQKSRHSTIENNKNSSLPRKIHDGRRLQSVVEVTPKNDFFVLFIMAAGFEARIYKEQYWTRVTVH